MFNVHNSEQAVVAHACHGHRCQPLPVSLSGTGKKKSGEVKGGGGTTCTGGYKGVRMSSPTKVGSRWRVV